MSCKDSGATSPPPLSLLPARHDRDTRDCIRGNLGERVENGPRHASRAVVRWPHITAAETRLSRGAPVARRASLGIRARSDGRRCGRRRRDQEKHEHGDRSDDQREKRSADSGRQGPPPRRHRRLKLPRVVNRADRTAGMPRTGFFSDPPAGASGAARRARALPTAPTSPARTGSPAEDRREQAGRPPTASRSRRRGRRASCRR
jgi:hypothetical protein